MRSRRLVVSSRAEPPGGRESAWSMLVSNTSLEAAPASPPRELRAAGAHPPARSVELSWAPPAKPNGLVTGYVVMFAVQRLPQAEEWTAVAVPGDRARVRLDRLRSRTTYLFKVQARNAKGLGPFCQPVAFTTAVGQFAAVVSLSRTFIYIFVAYDEALTERWACRVGRRWRPGDGDVGVAVGVGGRRVRSAGARGCARALALLPPLAAAALAGHQVPPSCVPTPTGMSAHFRQHGTCRARS